MKFHCLIGFLPGDSSDSGNSSLLYFSAKKSFYYYAFFLAILNLCQAIGSALLYTGTLNGLW